MIRASIVLLFTCAALAQSPTANQGPTASRPKNYPDPTPGDYIAHNFTFKSGESLPEARIHYYTLGTPQRDASGRVTNAVLILHGTGGSGRQFFGSPASSANFAEQLFGPGEPLDVTKYFVVMPDNIGHGGSSKPSDGLRMRFPHYDYDDMVRLQHDMLADGLKVNHLRLVMGTSMGCMHSWVWAETYPDFIDAAMPLACLPVEIAGRNRIWRKSLMDSIRNDPKWNDGNYSEEPVEGLTDAEHLLIIVGLAPLQAQKTAPTREAADKQLAGRVAAALRTSDANDMLYYFDSSRDYNPDPKLGEIRAPVMAVNSADDFINPPELGIMEQEIKKVAKGRYVLIPISDETRGHGSHTVAKLWKQYLVELLAESQPCKAGQCGRPTDDLQITGYVQLPAVRSWHSPEVRADKNCSTLLHLVVSPAGAIMNPEVQVSSGEPNLDKAALEALRDWSFEPAEKDGAKVAVQLNVRFDYAPGRTAQPSILLPVPSR